MNLKEPKKSSTLHRLTHFTLWRLALLRVDKVGTLKKYRDGQYVAFFAPVDYIRVSYMQELYGNSFVQSMNYL